LRDSGPVSFVCRRLVDQDYSVLCILEFFPARQGQAADLALFQSEDFNYRLELAFADDERVVRVALAAVARGGKLSFYYGPGPGSLALLASGVDGSVLSTERAGGFVGCVAGVYATGGGSVSPETADFDSFEYRGL
jgi:alpha-N-arabinofuranosidase